jgi:hypothetical protein
MKKGDLVATARGVQRICESRSAAGSKPPERRQPVHPVLFFVLHFYALDFYCS